MLGLPVEAPERRHVWNQYVVRVPDGRRDALREHLAKHKIGSEIYYPGALAPAAMLCLSGLWAGQPAAYRASGARDGGPADLPRA